MVEHPDVTTKVLEGIQAAMPDTVVPIREPREHPPVTIPQDVADSAEVSEHSLSTQNSK